MHTVANDRKNTRKKAAAKQNVIAVTRGSTTVKAHRVKNRDLKIFVLAWFVGGRRFRQNFANEKRVRHEAAALAANLNRGEAQSISLTGADRDAYSQFRQELAPLNAPAAGLLFQDCRRPINAGRLAGSSGPADGPGTIFKLPSV